MEPLPLLRLNPHFLPLHRQLPSLSRSEHLLPEPEPRAEVLGPEEGQQGRCTQTLCPGRGAGSVSPRSSVPMGETGSVSTTSTERGANTV